jgi:hypothetical protein
MNGDGEKTNAWWHPEGSEEKEFAELFIDGLFGFLGEKVQRKNMGELRIASYPSHDIATKG